MTLLDGFEPIRGRDDYATELQAISEARAKLKDGPPTATGSLPEFMGRFVLLQAGYRCMLPVAIEEQDESERQARSTAQSL
jgi:hypothetical protein